MLDLVSELVHSFKVLNHPYRTLDHRKAGLPDSGEPSRLDTTRPLVEQIADEPKLTKTLRIGVAAIVLSGLIAFYWFTRASPEVADPLQDAATTLEEILATNHRDEQALANLGTVYLYQKRYREAAQLFERRLEITPEDASVAGFLADAYSLIDGEDENAVELYWMAIWMTTEQLAMRPDSAMLLSSLTKYYSRLSGRNDLSARDSTVALLSRIQNELSQDESAPAAVFAVGEVYEQMGDREKAVSWIKSSLGRGYGRMQLTHSPWLEKLRSDPGLSGHLQ